VNQLPKASRVTRSSPRGVPSDPRYEIVVEEELPLRRASWSLLAELKSLGERGGSLIGAAYAFGASAVLNRVARLEDLNAERRFGKRSKTSPSVRAPAGGVTPSPRKSLQPAR
jgi:hypothetical protein